MGKAIKNFKKATKDVEKKASEELEENKEA